MDGNLVAALFFIFSIGGTVGLIYYYYHTRHKERMMLIEKGADASLFQSKPKNKRNYFFTVVLGILFLSIALGIFAGFIFSNLAEGWGWISNDDNPLPYFIGVLMMIGIGFITSFFASKKLNQ